MKKNKTLFLAISITALFVLDLAVVQRSQTFQTQKIKAGGGVSCDANGYRPGQKFPLDQFGHAHRSDTVAKQLEEYLLLKFFRARGGSGQTHPLRLSL